MIIGHYIETYLSRIIADLSGLSIALIDTPIFSPQLSTQETINELLSPNTMNNSQQPGNISRKFTMLLYNRTAPRKSENVHNTQRPILVHTDSDAGIAEVRQYTQSAFDIEVKLLTNDLDFVSKLLQYFLCDLVYVDSVVSDIKINGVENLVRVNLTQDNLTVEDFMQDDGDAESLHLVSWTAVLDAPLISPKSEIYDKIEKLIVNIYNMKYDDTILYKILTKDLTI